MGFKVDTSFLRYLTMGAMGVRVVKDQLVSLGFRPIELERYCDSNKIWTQKVKRLRLPDLVCIKTGLRVEVRTKTNLSISMSDTPNNPDRAWDAGLRGEDVIAFIKCFDRDTVFTPADSAVYFQVEDLKNSEGSSNLGQAKSASEGAERTRTWPSIVSSRDGTVRDIIDDKLKVSWDADSNRPEKNYTYTLKGKNVYVSVSGKFKAESSIIAGAPTSLTNLSSHLTRNYSPINDLESIDTIDRYTAIKSIPHLDNIPNNAIRLLEHLLENEKDDRVALEAAGSATFLGSQSGQDLLSKFIWCNDERPDLRMEAVFILSELKNLFSRQQLLQIASSDKFQSDELRQAAVWGLGKSGLKAYKDLIPFIDDDDGDVALHAISAFGSDTPETVIKDLTQKLAIGNPRQAAASSKALTIISGHTVIDTLVRAYNNKPEQPEWIIATLGQINIELLNKRIGDAELMQKLTPIILANNTNNWLVDENISDDMRFLLKQNL